jgi:aspartyl-tRNA(Asn)/glutamyl-tRNA(Gln) amidotransferase subunit A
LELFDLTIHETIDLLVKNEITPKELVDSYNQRIRQVDGKVKSYAEVLEEGARKTAEESAKGFSSGKPGSLAGVPHALKDNICTKNIKTTCSSNMLKEFNPPYNATVVEKLAAQGSPLLGKASMVEFDLASDMADSADLSRNPWDLNRLAGDGAAAAVAAGEAAFALGSDAIGQVRQPAAMCGVVGLKPTYGVVSRYGLVTVAPSLDQVGTITKDVTDCAIVMNVIAGHDPFDSTSLNYEVPDFTTVLIPDVKGFKIGVPKEYFDESVRLEVKDAVFKALDVFKSLGATWEEISMPHTKYSYSAGLIITAAEACSNLARMDGIQYGRYAEEYYDDLDELYKNTRGKGFGTEAKFNILFGTYVLRAEQYDEYYLKAQKVRTLIKQDFDQVFEKYDCLITPTLPVAGFDIGNNNSIYPGFCDIRAVSANLAGVPALTLPCGFADRLPVGLQLIGRSLGEATLIRAAYAFEQATNFHKDRPKLV